VVSGAWESGGAPQRITLPARLTGESTNLEERLGIVGSGTIAVRLACLAAERGDVVLFARSEDSAARAREELGDGGRVVTDLAGLSDATFVVEAIVEDHDAKSDVLQSLNDVLPDEAIVATTTSSLSVEKLAREYGRAERFVGLHVFNPVDKMELVELVFPSAVTEDTRTRTEALCDALDKTAVEVPDIPGFVVNRLLFPLLFAAVALLDEHELSPKEIDACMKLGAGHPMGPLALLDFVGLDVAVAIGESIDVEVPDRVHRMVADGKLGKKSGGGFYEYG
jgi:3-hydroxybutyryl-CoA dehydrogenase